MFAKLTGILDPSIPHHADGAVIMDVQGVGYLVHCSKRTLQQCLTGGAPTTLWIETHVREDKIQLFGFSDTNEQQWFRLLLTVQGVGAKSALSILGVLSANELYRAIVTQEKTWLTRADGVGPKLAVRIVTELKDKVQNFAALPADAGSRINRDDTGASPILIPSGMVETSENHVQEAVAALVHLGFNKQEASSTVLRLSQQYPEWNIETLIRTCLQELSR